MLFAMDETTSLLDLEIIDRTYKVKLFHADFQKHVMAVIKRNLWEHAMKSMLVINVVTAMSITTKKDGKNAINALHRL